jgi:sirohydrochlorin cobaltochelatase
MANSIERCLEPVLTAPLHFGEVLVQEKTTGYFVLSHRDDESAGHLKIFRNAEDGIEIAKYDDKGSYRPLKTAPNLRHGWRLELDGLEEVTRALDFFYPGRLAIFAAWKSGRLQTTVLRETLYRQSGMYRVAAKISDSQIEDLVADFCRSDGGCLRTILWKRDRRGTVASTKLPNQKFDPDFDQAKTCSRRPVGDAMRGSQSAQRRASHSEAATADIPATIPLLCQEACNLLIAECRKAVKGE